MDKDAFYSDLRTSRVVFGSSLSSRQVEGVEALLQAGAALPLCHLAHVLGEVYHETGGGMYPVKETVFPHHKNKSPTDAQVIARLDRAWSQGLLPWVKSPYWRKGWFGRGMIQITHESNYKKLSPVVSRDLAGNPDQALDVGVSAEIAVEGCRLGLFTGKKLASFDGPNGYDHHNARAIVNGDKGKNGKAVSGYAQAFASALDASGYGEVTQAHPKSPETLTQIILSTLKGVFK